MKKLVALLIAAALMISLSTACNNGSDSQTSDANNSSDSQQSNSSNDSNSNTQANSNDSNTQASSNDSGAQASSDDSGAQASKERYFNTWELEEVSTVDSSNTGNTVDEEIILNLMEPLTRLIPTADGGYEFIPAGAKSWSSNDDQTVWTFIMNDNFWEDGVAVTAYDYEYAIKRTADPATGSPLSWMLDFLENFDYDEVDLDALGVKATDEKNLVITLEEPVPYFMDVTSKQVMTPQRQDIVELYGERYGSGAEFFLSCGPFKFESWAPGGTIVLVKNDKYWDADNVALDRASFALMSDTNARMAAFESGEIDFIRASSEEWVDRFMNMGGVEYHPVPSQTLLYYFFNTADDIFQNVKIRRAFVIGLDREQLCEMVYTGLREPTYGWIVPSASVGEYNFRAAAGDVVKEMIADYGDPRELLIEGMQELGLGDDPSTLKIVFSLAGTDEFFHTIGEYLQQTYKASLGVNLEIDFSEWGIFYPNVESGDYQIAQMTWGLYYNDPSDIFSLYRSGNDYVSTGWENAEFDDLIYRATREQDDAKRLQLYIEAERLLIYDQAVAVPVCCTVFQNFQRDYVSGIKYSTFGDVSLKWHDTSARP